MKTKINKMKILNKHRLIKIRYLIKHGESIRALGLLKNFYFPTWSLKECREYMKEFFYNEMEQAKSLIK